MKAALLAQKANVDPHKMRYVAFEGGGEPVTALLGNHVQAVSGDLSEMVPYLQGNKIRVLAVFSSERLPGALADVPTAKEQGYDWSGRLFAASLWARKSATPSTSGGSMNSLNCSKPKRSKAT